MYPQRTIKVILKLTSLKCNAKLVPVVYSSGSGFRNSVLSLSF
jgi:hypothetical protein